MNYLKLSETHAMRGLVVLMCLSMVLDAYREEYDSSDWYVDGFGPLDVNRLLTMGELSPDHDVNVIRLLANLRF